MNEQRRTFVRAGLTAGVVLLAGTRPSQAATPVVTLDAIPPLPTSPTPGKPGDFDFLTGERIAARFHLDPAPWYSRRPSVRAISISHGSGPTRRAASRVACAAMLRAYGCRPPA